MRPALALLLLAALSACRSELLCPAGQSDCGGRCVALASDAANCGACGHAVGALERCALSVAVCRAGIATCGGACTDLARDPGHCGACDQACSGATPYCATAGGVTACAATCPGGLVACGFSCVDPQTDPYDCGACGHVCAAGETCREGACHSDLEVACYATDEVIPVAADLGPAGAPRRTAAGPAALATLGGAVYAATGYPQASVSVLPLDPSVAPTTVLLTGSDLEGIAAYGNVLLVTNAGVGTLAVLSPAGEVLGEIPLPAQQSGPNPHGVDAADGLAYVALYGSATSGQAIAKVSLSGLAACAAGAAPCGSVLSAVDLLSVPGTADAAGLPFPSQVLMTGGRAYVTLANLTLGANPWDSAYYVKPAGHGKLAVVTPGTPDAVQIVDLGASCGNPGALAVSGTTLWVACGSFSYPALAPPVLLPVELQATPPVPGTPVPVPGMVPGNLAFCGWVGYVTDQASGAVARFDPGSRTVSSPVVVCPTSAGPYGFAWAADIACSR